MKGHPRGCGPVHRLADGAGRQALRPRCHQQPDDPQPGFLRQRREGGKRPFLFHRINLSIDIDLLTEDSGYGNVSRRDLPSLPAPECSPNVPRGMQEETRMSQTSLQDQRGDNIPLAVGTIILTVLALSLGDALIKMTSGSFVIWQIFVIRSLIVIPVLLGVLASKAQGKFRLPDAIPWVALRSLMLVGMWVCYYLSLPELTLSAAAAAYYTLPIFISLFSALFIGDRISRAGWAAVFIGFSGVLLILRPEAGDFNAYAILPLISAMLYAGAMILTRTRCRQQDPIMLSLALNISFVIVGALAAAVIALLPETMRQGFLLAPWSDMGPSEWISMTLLATAILIGSIGAAIAYQNGPPAMVGTFDFAYVGFAVIWGLVFFAEVPDAISSLGMLLIVGAGILSLRR
ncbi:DMT family transporter [Paracoccus alcaliphilus]|nr:DMT family transporter [Paracoccus alcaliphilus]